MFHPGGFGCPVFLFWKQLAFLAMGFGDQIIR
jgi:hypothetical protein